MTERPPCEGRLFPMPPKKPSPKRSLLLALRSKIKIMRCWDDVYVSGSTIRSTCRTCQHVVTQELTLGPRGSKKVMSPWAVRKLVKYWAGASGSRAVCPACTKRHRYEKYPLPSKEA